MLLLIACTKTPPDSGDSVPAYENFKPEGAEVLTLTTRDEVSIEADYWAASADERPAVILIHMDPSSGAHRGNWDGTYLQLLIDSDWHVLVPDRRGAGGSTGTATDAYETVKGSYDVEACVGHLPEGAATLSLVGASNGTTTMIDYAALADAEGWRAPDTLQFLSAVRPTTNNHEIADVPATPALFSFPKNEADNNAPWQDANPGDWSFQEYDPGDHGTRMFQNTPELPADLHGWLDGQID